MEIFTTKVKTNLNGVLQTTHMIEGIMMTGDNAANEILVELYRGIDRVTIDTDPSTTRIVGYFIRPDGETLEVNGSVENNMAKVVIPEAAYQVSGTLSIAVRMLNDPYTAQYRGYYDSETGEFVQVTDETIHEGPHGEEIVYKQYEAWKTKIVIAALNCFVQLTETDSIIDPGHHIPDVQELLSYISALDQKQYEIGQAELARENAEKNRATAEGEREAAEGIRQQIFETNEIARQANETTRQENEGDREAAELAREKAEKGNNLDGSGGRVKAEADRVLAEAARETAQAARNAMIDGMTVAAMGLDPYSEPTATISEVNGHKHILFGLTPGDPFVIAKTFASIAEMEAYTGTDVRVGQFVIISSTEEDPDNAKMYVKTSNGWSFVTDLSGAQGIQGPRGFTGNGISSAVLNQDYTLTLNFTDGTSFTTSNPIRGATGATGNGIALVELNQDYTLTITMTNGTTYTTPIPIRGSDGEKGDTGNGIQSAVMNADYTLSITWTNGTTFTTPPLKGEPGAAGTNFTFDSEDSALTIEYF